MFVIAGGHKAMREKEIERNSKLTERTSSQNQSHEEMRSRGNEEPEYSMRMGHDDRIRYKNVRGRVRLGPRIRMTRMVMRMGMKIRCGRGMNL